MAAILMPGDCCDVIVVIGRFMLPHNAHLALLKQALAKGLKVVVVLGSAFHARTTKNCFTWDERERMFRLCLTDAENDRVTFVPLRDYYSMERWLPAVKKKVEAVVGAGANIRVLGHFKDASSEYLAMLPWPVIESEEFQDMDATTMRTILYEAEKFEYARAAMAPYVPAPILGFLQVWCQLPYLKKLREEHFHLKREKEQHPQPYGVAADFVFEYGDHVLMMERVNHPGKDLLAFPGGFWEPRRRETLFQCALREAVDEETGLGMLKSDIIGAYRSQAFFDAPDRSVRGPIASMAYHFKMPGNPSRMPELVSRDGEARPLWMPKAEFPSLEERTYDDHYLMGHHFLQFELQD